MLTNKKIAIIGVGKMGETLLNSMIKNNLAKKENLSGSTAQEEHAKEISKKYDVRTYIDNKEMVLGKDIIILAVKPQMMKKVISEVKEEVTERQLIISIAAATSTQFIEECLEKNIPVIRAMPNTPALINEGMTVLCPGKYIDKNHIQMAIDIFGAVGLVEVVYREELMDVVTALSGSGPAYTYIIIESLTEGGVRMGLPRELAQKLSAQTLLGAAKMVLKTGMHPALLKDAVTTPAGVTVDGLMELEDGGIRVTLIKAISRATEKSKELSR
ncbi:MAG TPA: pyrroline-5-carboxylate reductase [Candidatus Atribacteria bacterium]|jgi:pyrroline-5-carboxylate reductase|nr:MAG: Pyrroline-5-carboxylate reductase [Atribacteria bacterium 34_128]HAJ33078.1 pyrroline-5-carboxylate reductase [Candidatus Atribacteria bacterium]